MIYIKKTELCGVIAIKNKAIFLDRDGVINEVVFHKSDKPSSPWNFNEFKLLPHVKEPLAEFTKMGYLLFIISNQPDISRGFIEKGITEKISRIIYDKYPIKEIMICPHDDHHNCNCRKPNPGMILELSKKYNIDLKKSFLIGDNWKDIEAGQRAGVITILINYPYNKSVKTDYRVKNLVSAVKLIKSIEK